jgi:hypothetical protein
MRAAQKVKDLLLLSPFRERQNTNARLMSAVSFGARRSTGAATEQNGDDHCAKAQIADAVTCRALESSLRAKTFHM